MLSPRQQELVNKIKSSAQLTGEEKLELTNYMVLYQSYLIQEQSRVNELVSYLVKSVDISILRDNNRGFIATPEARDFSHKIIEAIFEPNRQV